MQRGVQRMATTTKKIAPAKKRKSNAREPVLREGNAIDFQTLSALSYFPSIPPDGDGEMPISAAVHWIASEGRKIDHDLLSIEGEAHYCTSAKVLFKRATSEKAGKYSDGGNLYLVVPKTRARKWVLRFTWRGRAKEMGLGSAASVPLADAARRPPVRGGRLPKGLTPLMSASATAAFPRSARWLTMYGRHFPPASVTRSTSSMEIDAGDLCRSVARQAGRHHRHR
jgi:hypothetical protein